MKPCVYCETPVDAEIHEAEMGMCLDCSNEYFSHDHQDCSWACMAEFGSRMKERVK